MPEQGNYCHKCCKRADELLLERFKAYPYKRTKWTMGMGLELHLSKKFGDVEEWHGYVCKSCLKKDIEENRLINYFWILFFTGVFLAGWFCFLYFSTFESLPSFLQKESTTTGHDSIKELIFKSVPFVVWRYVFLIAVNFTYINFLFTAPSYYSDHNIWGSKIVATHLNSKLTINGYKGVLSERDFLYYKSVERIYGNFKPDTDEIQRGIGSL